MLDVQDEDKRLDVIMEVHRLNGIKAAERVEQEKIIKRREGKISFFLEGILMNHQDSNCNLN